jgi:stage III sporulation protein AA
MLHTPIAARRESGAPDMILGWLPMPLAAALCEVGGQWEEVHLRVGRSCSVTVNGENRRVDATLSREEMDALLLKLCQGSMYAYRQSINQGYLTLDGGIRVGVCGRACAEGEGEGLLAVREIDALCVRFPRPVRAVGRQLALQLREDFPLGALIYAPPGVGKTTLLRALAEHFACGESPMRVCLVDSRCELNDGCFSKDACLSILSAYPKGQGIEIAARCMNAQLILCDEIGNDREAEAVLAAANCGVPIVATAHAASVGQLLMRPGFDVLHSAGVFASYVGIRRRTGASDYLYDICRRKDVTL